MVKQARTGIRLRTARPASKTGKCSRTCARLVALLTGAFLLVCPLASAARAAQTPARQARLDNTLQVLDFNNVKNGNPFAAVVHVSEEATTLLTRADEALTRQDWKLVVDSLQRIVELPGEHVLTSDGLVYESARLHAHRRIAALPAAGIRAYRLIHDDQASTLLAKARNEHDESLLGTLVEEFLLTSVGDEAAVTLADWWIDEGRFAKALALLQRIESLYPDSDLPPWIAPSKQAVCWVGMEHRQRADEIMNRLRDQDAVLTLLSRSNTTKVSDRMPPDRLEALRAYIQHSQVRPHFQSDAWPMAYGNAARNSKVPTIEPAFRESLPWRVALDGGEERKDLNRVMAYARRKEWLPTTDMVTDGWVLIVRCGTLLMGLDVLTFEPIWQVGTQQFGLEHAGTKRETNKNIGQDAFVRRRFGDSVASGVTIAFGLVLTVEWAGESPDEGVWLARRRTEASPRRAQRSFDTHPNVILAYSPKDGSRVWMSDTVRGDEALGPVQFLAAPIPYHGYLLAPCRVGSDLYAVLLDPHTGKMARHFYLCGTGGGPFDSLQALMPCVADGVAYIPTGRGALVALEGPNGLIRWIVRYDHLGSPSIGQRLLLNDAEIASEFDTAKEWANPNWLAMPPLAVSDVVLLAPNDVDRLFCFERFTGTVRWSIERMTGTYLLGATDARVWVVGKNVRAVDIETGRQVWKQSCGVPAGRGVRAGDRLYLPTQDGLMTLDAETGRIIGDQRASTSLLLGNLLAFGASIYSASVFDIRKFPDLDRGYKMAVAAHAANPTDPVQTIRLAWLQYLKDQPAQTLVTLAELPETLKQNDPGRYRHVAHLRVLAMLELATSTGVLPDKALELLTTARNIAEMPGDAIHSTLALGDFLCRTGRPLQACLEYLSLALSPAGDFMMSPTQHDDESTETFEYRARVVAGQQLHAASRQLTPADAAALQDKMRDRLHDDAAQHDEQSILWLAETKVPGDVGYEAELVLAIGAVRDLRFEQAETSFLRVIRHATSLPLRADAAARLATIYLEPDELHQPVSATALLDRLQNEFTGVELRADILDADWGWPWDEGDGHVSTMAANRLAVALSKRVEAMTLSRNKLALDRIVLGEPRAPTVSKYENARPIRVRGPRPEAMADKTLVLIDGRKIEAHAADDARLLWPATLRLLGELAVESKLLVRTQRFPRLRRGYIPCALGVAEGQMLVLNTSYGIHALGLLTGRRLWSYPFTPPGDPAQDLAGSDQWLWVHDGYIISVDKSGLLRVARAERGDRVVWRRTLPKSREYAVRARGSYVAVANAELTKVHIFRLADGEHLGECRFEQSDIREQRVNITLHEEVVCGPVSSREIVAFELATPGVERWRVSLPMQVSAVFKPTPELLAVADPSGAVQIIDPVTGKSLMQARVSACEEGIRDGTLLEGVLYVYGIKQQDREPNRRLDVQRYGLAAINMNEGTVRWQRDDIAAQAYFSPEILSVSRNAIPVAVWVPPNQTLSWFRDDPQSNRGRGRVALVLLDKATGQPIGDTIWTALESSTDQFGITDVQVRPDGITVVVGTTHVCFPVVTNANPAGVRPQMSHSRAQNRRELFTPNSE